jgi:hypothetical protein
MPVRRGLGVPAMKLSVKTASAACAVALSFASPVWAQSPQPGPRAGAVLPPYEVLTSVRSMGLDPVGRPALRGRVYVLRAFDATNFEKRVVVDARSGEVLSVRDAIDTSPAYTPYDPRYGHYEPPRPPAGIARAEPAPDIDPILDEPLFPRPTRVAPGPSTGVRAAAVNPHAPLPKTRPATAAPTVATATTTTQDTKAASAAPPPTSSPSQATGSENPLSAASATTGSGTPLPSADALAAASSTPGKSVPAPVASHAYVGPRLDPQKPPADKSVTQLVPVAPLE